MPPKKAKPAESKKTVQKKKAAAVEDKTFGLKNKNKSKKVQNQIASIEKSVMNSGDPKMRKLEEERRKAKADAKARKQAMKEEQNALFGEALLAVQKKGAGTNQKFGKIEAKGRDADDDDKKSTSRAMKMMYQMDAQEMEDKLREDPNYVPTLDDEIEAQRQQKVQELQQKGIQLTPVTEESFAAWQERKRKSREDEAKKKVEAEFRKKKGGKGLSILTGRDLYSYKKELFDKFDDDADDEGEEGEGEGEGGAVVENGNANAPATTITTTENGVDQVAAQVQSELFLHGDDDDLDDLLEDD